MTAPGRERREQRVPTAHAGRRLDSFLAEIFALGRKAARRAILEGQVQVAGRAIRRPSAPLREGQLVELWAEPEHLAPDPGPLDVVTETDELVVVLKPAGQPTAPLRTLERGSLCGRLVARYPEMRGVGFSPREPGVLHRLDTGTSGLVLAARTERAFEAVRALSARGRFRKRYLALVWGTPDPPSGVIDAPLEPDPSRAGSVHLGGSYPARSSYRVIERGHGKSLVELSIERAYRHQIRVHLASIGHPLLGDPRYDPERRPAPRLALHASTLELQGEPPYQLVAESKLPAELAELLVEGA
ncbi:MAG: RluA family pseudouridine synthase [Polyangiaceae bacterium]|nr:RluA family pseudouridine synthase [Polyangiaceae bacterium]MCW5788965.1 RluA family pseudouridine synthase [Polyangiaceae bacterium]